MHSVWLCGALVVAPALVVPSTFAIAAAPTSVAPIDRTPGAGNGCWAGIARSEAAAGQKYVEDDLAAAAKLVLSALDLARTCGEPDMEQKLLVIRLLKLILVDFGAIRAPSEREVDVIHTWHARLAAEPALAALASSYQRFTATYPLVEESKPPPDPPETKSTITAPQPRPEGPSDSDRPLLPTPDDTVRRTRARGLQIGGASLLALGVGGIAGGFVTLSRIDAQYRALVEKCTPACTNASDAAPLIRRGELYEDLTPALLAVGGTLAITGAVLVGVGTHRRKSPRSALTPVLAPRFAGASWTIGF